MGNNSREGGLQPFVGGGLSCRHRMTLCIIPPWFLSLFAPALHCLLVISAMSSLLFSTTPYWFLCLLLCISKSRQVKFWAFQGKMATGGMPWTSLTSGCTQSPSSLWWWQGGDSSQVKCFKLWDTFCLHCRPDLLDLDQNGHFVEADISVQRRKAVHILVTLFSQGKQ